jgi:hypothetical protein
MHKAAAGVMLAMVILHVIAVTAATLHRENLVGAMITGRKVADPGSRSDGPSCGWRRCDARPRPGVLVGAVAKRGGNQERSLSIGNQGAMG